MTSTVRRALLTCCIVVILVGIVLLLNLTAPNPTGRRYSGDTVDLDASSTDKGLQGENILATDLNLWVTNERSTNPVCICNSRFEGTVPPGSTCGVCVAYSESVSNFRIPDFVTNGYFAESKNARDLIVSHARDYEQIQEMAAVAEEINQPLWIYVRTETYVDHEYFNLARSTGGDVVYYFRDTLYVDPVDQIARILIIVGASGAVLVLGWEAWRWIQSQTPDEPEEDIDAIDEAADDTVDETENFMRRVERLSRKELDKPDDTHRKR
jgi:hypothetical protein